MARQVLPIIGAAVGALFGVPQLGWAIGSVLGNAIDPQVIKGPSIGEIAQQTAQEGGPRPFLIGTSPPIAGNVIASGEPRIVKKTSGGKGGPKVKTESVYRTYAIGVGEGEQELLRAWRNNTLVYDVSEASLVTAAQNAKFLQTARWFTGTFLQDPSPDLEAIFGVGTTPAHRGTAYLVMADEDLTDLRGAIPQWTFQTQSCPVLEILFAAPTPGSFGEFGYDYDVFLALSDEIERDYFDVFSVDDSAFIATNVTTTFSDDCSRLRSDPPRSYYVVVYKDSQQVAVSNTVTTTFENTITMQAAASSQYIGYMSADVRLVVQGAAVALGFLAENNVLTGIDAFYKRGSDQRYILIPGTMGVFDHINFKPTGIGGVCRLLYSDATPEMIGSFPALTWSVPAGLAMDAELVFTLEVIF